MKFAEEIARDAAIGLLDLRMENLKLKEENDKLKKRLSKAVLEYTKLRNGK